MVSCASINNSSLIEYSGKLLIDQNGKEQFSFNIHVAINRNTSIIQIKKPLFGNVLKIIAAKDKDLTFIQSENGKFYLKKGEYKLEIGKVFESFEIK